MFLSLQQSLFPLFFQPEQTVQPAPVETAESAEQAEKAEPAETATAQPAPETPDADKPQD